MIPRYDSAEISCLFSDRHRFETFLKIELAVLEALEGKEIPKGIAESIRKTVKIKPERIAEIEKVTRHDIIAFCTSITEQLPEEVGRFFHFGVTSSDIIDSALQLQIKEALELILPKFEELLEVLHKKAEQYKSIISMGRSHGMFAEPMSFGVKFLGHYAEFRRRFSEYKNFLTNDLTVQISGAVGNYTILSPDIEQKVAKTLGFKVESVSTQVIPRDRHAKLTSLGALTACAIERLAVEIRHLHRSEVQELTEGFSKGQKGSSIMPHKKNPISSENLTGISRVLRSQALIAWENTPLWHERDISHSSAERLYLPDHLGLLHYALNRLTQTLRHLQIDTEQIESLTKREQSYLSSYYLHFLIKKTTYSRETIYKWVQQASFESVKQKKNIHEVLSSLMKKENIALELPHLDFSQIKKIYLNYTNSVFKRVMTKD